MKIFELNQTQAAIVCSQEEYQKAENIILSGMQEGEKFSSNVTMDGDTVKAFIWGITQETKTKLYALAGQGSGVKVEGVAENTFTMPDKKTDPKLQQKVEAAVAEMKKQPNDLEKVKAVVKNAKTFCYQAWSQLFQQLYGTSCPAADQDAFVAWVEVMKKAWIEAIDKKEFDSWRPWVEYIYDYGTQMYKANK